MFSTEVIARLVRVQVNLIYSCIFMNGECLPAIYYILQMRLVVTVPFCTLVHVFGIHYHKFSGTLILISHFTKNWRLIFFQLLVLSSWIHKLKQYKYHTWLLVTFSEWMLLNTNNLVIVPWDCLLPGITWSCITDKYYITVMSPLLVIV